MATITLKGNPCNTIGNLPKVGSKAPNFSLTRSDLSTVTLDQYKGKRVILNIFPSLDTPVCAISIQKFNSEASKQTNTVILCISMDLPFAASRFCGANNIENVQILSNFKNSTFGKDYGVQVVDGPLEGLFARAIVVIDPNQVVQHTELVPEIAEEPKYDKALAA